MCPEYEQDEARTYPERVEKDILQIRQITDRLIRCLKFLPCGLRRRLPEINQLIYILRRLECNVPLSVDREVFYENRCKQLEKLIVDLINGQTPHDGILKVDPDNTPFYIFKTRENTNLFIKKE